MRWYNNNIFSEDSDLDDNGHKTESMGNDDGGNDDDGDDGDDDDGIFRPLGGQIPGPNEPRAEQAPNNNADDWNLEAFDWDGFSDDGTVGGAYPRNRSPTPSGDGGARNIQSSQDYDDVRSGGDGSDGNVRNENDDDHGDNVQNKNDEEAPNNAAVGGDVQAALEGLQNDVPGQPEEVPEQQGLEINIPEGLNENLN
jgi:hypothetical protein